MRYIIVWLLLSSPAVGQLRLMSEAKDKTLRAALPWVNDPDVQRVLDSPDTVLYTDAEIPPAYQDFSTLGSSVRDPSYNHSGDPRERAKGHGYGGNGNVEFPWRSPAGTEPCDNVDTFRFFRLPRRGGRLLPVVYWRAYPASTGRGGIFATDLPTYHWIFPTGTIFGEVLTMQHPRTGRWYTFELRVRIRESTEWAVDVFRPYPEAEDLQKKLVALRTRTDGMAARQLQAWLQRPPPRRGRLQNNHPRKLVFREVANVDYLSSIPDSLVHRLLTTQQFQSSLGVEWKAGVHAPTTREDWHIVPRGYRAGFIPVDRVSCLRCHDSCGKHVSVFEDRDWYGCVRGGDGIFTWHFFDPSCISSHRESGYVKQPRLRQSFIRAGIVEEFDAGRHRPPLYSLIPQLYYENRNR